MLRDVLEKGYFPRELPPAFTTASYAAVIDAAPRPLPGNFALNTRNALPRAAQPVTHNVARAGRMRRRMEIPNPILHANLVQEFVTSWTSIIAFINGMNFSSTRPRYPALDGRGIGPENGFGERPRLRAASRVGGRYLLRADISRFYHSIYTHSIPWALHTKTAAKQRQNRQNWSMLGVRLDYFIRRAQDDQTMGIPIGPDTSLVIAEILLRRLDEELQHRLGRLKGFRAVDDYELSFATAADAEQGLAELQATLLEYELDINDLKTEIAELPQWLEEPWTVPLATMRVSRRNHISQKYDLLYLTTQAFDTSKRLPGSSSIRYVLGRLSRIRILRQNWDLYQNILFQCALGESDTLSYVLTELIRYKAAGLTVDHAQLQVVLNSAIVREAPIGQGNEVAWALWGLLVFDLALESEAARAVSSLEDSICALMALDLQSRGRAAATLDTRKWQAHVSGDGLYQGQWLLAYEAPGHGWLRARGGRDPVLSDSAFALLRSNSVRFYEEPGNIAATLSQVPLGPLPPEGAEAPVTDVVRREAGFTTYS